MNRWMSGETRSNKIAKMIADSRSVEKKRPDIPRAEPQRAEVTTQSLNISINLLDNEEVTLDEIAASPLLSTQRVAHMFPPQMVATPTGDSQDSWVLTQSDTTFVPESQSQSQSQPQTDSQDSNRSEPEPEKSKRSRER